MSPKILKIGDLDLELLGQTSEVLILTVKH